MDSQVATAVMAPTDFVGYGKWGELTYQELWDKEPEYCLWTLNKFQELVKEGEELATKYVVGDSKLKRLAQWITETDAVRAAVEPTFECDSDMEQVEVVVPGNETLGQRVAKLRAEKESNSNKFYAVALPEDHAGVYTSWAECKPHVIGIKGVMYKSFASEEEAAEYVRDPPAKKGLSEEAKAALEEARAAKEKLKEEAKAAKAAEVKAAKEAKEEAKTAKAAEARAAKEEARAAKIAAKRESLSEKKAKRCKTTSATKDNAEADVQTTTASAEDAAEDVTAKKNKKGPKKIMRLKSKKATAKAKAKAKAKTQKAKAKAKAATKSTEVAAKAEAKVKAPKAQAKADATKAALKATAEVTPEKAKTSQGTTTAAASSSKAEKPSKAGRASKAPTAIESEKIGAQTIGEELLKRSQELGMTSALRNLAARPEIISQGLSADSILDALVKADGLVNKAKNALLSPTAAPDLASPGKDVRMDRLSLPMSPEKVEQEAKVTNQDHEDLAKQLSNLSATLRLVSGETKQEDVHMKVATPSSLTAEQMQRIQENRERALARRAQTSN